MLTVQTVAPNGLLSKIRKAIDAGHVVTWAYDRDGDFTHTPPQWCNKAWLRPHVANGELRLTIIANKTAPLTKETYGVYHGRFVEMLLAHFRQDLQTTSAN